MKSWETHVVGREEDQECIFETAGQMMIKTNDASHRHGNVWNTVEHSKLLNTQSLKTSVDDEIEQKRGDPITRWDPSVITHLSRTDSQVEKGLPSQC